jgi:uncharacterized protein YndB with AHSA1/START domain
MGTQATGVGTQQQTGSTIRLHRVLKAPPERIFKAILDPAAICKWFPPYGYTCSIERMDAREGGLYRMAFTNFSTGRSQWFGGRYLDVKPPELIRATDAFDDPGLPGEMQTTYTLKRVSVGTEVQVVQENVPAAIPAEACYLGWQECLEQLAKLVEPENRDQP